MKKRIDKKKTAALAIAILLAALVGIWLFISPSLEKQRLQEKQAQLLESIESGDGKIVLDTPIADKAVDFYDTDNGIVISEPPTVSSTEPEAIAWTESDEPDAQENDSEPLFITGIGILTIDSIDLKMPVADGVAASQLKVSAGWVPQTAPIGEVGNAVIAGHRNYDYGSHFNRLGEVVVGDEIVYISKDGETLRFRVFEILEVLPGDPEAFVQPEDKSIITLLTCTPIRTATHRLLVRAELISQAGRDVPSLLAQATREGENL